MIRILSTVLGVVLLSGSVCAQGIRSVTRRTTTLERQQPARQFFESAGLNVTGAGTAAGATAPAVATTPVARNPALAARPRAVPMLTGAAPTPLRAAPARPYVLGPVKTGPGTNVASVANRPQPVPRHVAP